MGQYDRQIELGHRLIQKYGGLARWYKSGVSVIPDATKPWIKTNGVDTFNDVYIAFLDQGDAFLRHMLGGDVPTGGQYGLMGSVPFVPSLRDSVKVNGITYIAAEPLRKFSPNLIDDLLWIVNLAK